MMTLQRNSDFLLSTFYTIDMAKMSTAIVITVKNDEVGLQKLLQRIAEQTVLPDEVIITVANSLDESLRVAQSWWCEGITVKVISLTKATRAYGRNIGVAKAKSEIIVFTDAGCVPEKNWLEELTIPFQSQTTKLVSGLTWVKSKNSWEEAQAPFVLVPPNQIPVHPLPATRNMAILKTVFLKHKGFHPDLNFAEDYEFARRLSSKNILAEFVPSAVVWWQPRANIPEFMSMIYRLTSGDIQARTWRLGHFTMMARYAVFLSLPWFFSFWVDTKDSVMLSLLCYLFYICIKTVRFPYQNWKSYIWSPLLQLLTDLTILVSLGQALLRLKKSRK